MLKLTIPNPPEIENSNLIVFFQGEGASSGLALSLLLTNHPFTEIGYLYSPYISKVVSYQNQNSANVTFNGQIFYNQDKKLTLLKLTGGVPKKNMKEFTKEFIDFVKLKKFAKITLISGIEKENITDVDIQSREINYYYATNIANYENKLKLKPIKDAFKVAEEKRKNKIYYEMNLIEGCEIGKRIIQSLILEKINFVFMFCFADEFIDFYAGLGFYYKLRCALELGSDETVTKKEMSYKDILAEVKTKVKISDEWDLFLIE